MRSALMIAHTFPPEGSAGTYRPLRFVRHLPEFGWNPVVISSAKHRYDRYDPDLLGLIPTGIEVLRVRGRDPWQALQAWRARRQSRLGSVETAEGTTESRTTPPFRAWVRGAVRTAQIWHYHPDMARHWVRPAVAATIEACGRHHAHAIWATIGPVSSGIVAARASVHTDVPYVLDFRDPWGLDYYEADAKRPSWIKRADRLTLHRVLRGAQAVVFQFAAVAACYWRAYEGALEAERIHIIPNGYDGIIQESPIPTLSRCTILYAGTLSTYYRYDSLLQALVSLKLNHPDEARRLRVVFVGDSLEPLAAEVGRHGLGDIVDILPPISHAEISRLERDAHALLILGRDPTRKGHELVAGAKLFEYLKAGRPIIGVLPQDETRNVLSRVGASLVADVESLPEIVLVLRRLLDAWSHDTLTSLVPDRAACNLYSAERQTAALVRALEGAPAAERFVPETVQIPPSLRGDLCCRGVEQSSGTRNGADRTSSNHQVTG